jgi:uroporphyrinogen decarboxylase
LPDETLEETDEYRVIRDGNGATKKYWKERSGVPEFLGEFAIRTRDQWDEHKHRLENIDGRVELDELVQSSRQYRDADFFVCWGGYGFWEAARDLLGPEQLLMSVATDPRWVCEIMEYLETLFIRVYEALRAAGAYMDGIFFYDDLAYRHGLFFSPASYREFLWPSHCRIFRRMHDDGLDVVLHTCGNVNEAVPLLVEAGIDCLQPLEAKAGMRLDALKSSFGTQLALMGNVDVMALRTNDRDVIRREVMTKLEIGARGGGYVFHSDHSIPPEVTLETYRFCQELVDEFDDQV